MGRRSKADYRIVDRDSICQVTGKGHIPTTIERMEDGAHVKFHVCKECGGHIR
jgi:hypothetical protein